MKTLFFLLSLACAAGLSACAQPPAPRNAGGFSRLDFGRTPRKPTPAPSRPAPPPVQEAAASPPASASLPALRPRVATPSLAAPILPARLDQAEARVTAFLDRSGFALETRPDAGGALITATRMGLPAMLDGQATCGLEAMRRPTVSSTDLLVRLTPAPGGVRLEASARFVEIDTKLLSGELARETCRSKGVLESAVQQAALGG
jgi:hypothetical protein